MAEHMEDWDNIMYIAPNSSKEKVLFELANISFENISDNYFHTDTVILKNGKTSELKSIVFDERDTPLYIKYSIALSMGSYEENPIFFDNDFFIAKISKSTNLKPSKLESFINNDGDWFYTQTKYYNELYYILGVTGRVLEITGSVVLDIVASGEE